MSESEESRREETEAQGEGGLVQGHHPASYPADKIGLELPLTEGPQDQANPRQGP